MTRCEIKNISVGTGFAYLSNGMLDSFKIEGWVRDETENLGTGAECGLELKNIGVIRD